MHSDNALDFENNLEWRNWLQANHDKENEAWLVIDRKNSSQSRLGYQAALNEALCFGWIDGKMNSCDKGRFLLRFSPRKEKSIWSKKNKEQAIKLIESGKMTGAGLVSIEKAKKNGSWDSTYTSLKKADLPHDLEAALLENTKAIENFCSFANSYRNMYIGWVDSAKTVSTRQKRIIEVVKRSALNIKPGT